MWTAGTGPWRGFPWLIMLMLSVKTGNFLYKACLLDCLLTQRSLYFASKLAHMYLCSILAAHKSFWPNCCKTSSFGDIEAINCDYACRCLMGLACGPTACKNHQYTVTNQALGGYPQQPECHPLAEIKYDTFVTWRWLPTENCTIPPQTDIGKSFELDCFVFFSNFSDNTWSETTIFSHGRKPPFSEIMWPLVGKNVAQKLINYEHSLNKCTHQVWIGLREYFFR